MAALENLVSSWAVERRSRGAELEAAAERLLCEREERLQAAREDLSEQLRRRAVEVQAAKARGEKAAEVLRRAHEEQRCLQEEGEALCRRERELQAEGQLWRTKMATLEEKAKAEREVSAALQQEIRMPWRMKC